MKLSDYVADFVARQGVGHVFLLPGGGCMHLADSFGNRPGLQYICCLHEQACGFGAEAYAEYSNQLGCALVTAGPGGTNALTGAACAWLESAPVLFISGQAKRSDLIRNQPLPVRSMGQQEVDIVAMVRSITKYAVQVVDPAEIRLHLEKAAWLARNGRPGPVWVDIPLDVQAQQIQPEDLAGFVRPQDSAALGSTLQVPVLKILEFLRRAERPVIYAGNGIRTAGMLEEFRALVRELDIPVLLSWKAADFLAEDAPCYAGRPGAIGQRFANFTQQRSDWILVLGARLDLPSIAFNHANFAPGAWRTIVDVDEAEIAKFKGHFQCTVRTDLADFIPAMRKSISASGAIRRTEWKEWRARCEGWKNKYPVVTPEHRAANSPVSTYALMDVLSDLLVAEDVIVPGSSGPCSDIFYQAFRVQAGQRILNAPGLGAMGTGLPGSIGAAMASGKRVININGEGGFQLNIQELETARRLDLPVKFIVLDNGGYRSIVAMQRSHFQGRLVASDLSSGLTMPDTAKVAEAYGIKSFKVDAQPDLRRVLQNALGAPGPVVCVVKTSVDEVTAPRVTSEVRPDGSIVSKPMEDMWPFLPREVLAEEFAEIP